MHSLSAEALERDENFYEEYKEEFHEYMREQAEEELRGEFLYSHVYGVSGIAEEKLELTEGSLEREKQVYLLVGGVLSLLLALIGILNFVNAFITSIQARKNELAVMQSVGMTYRQLRTMLIGEGLSYILLTAIIALTAGTVLTYLLVRAFSAQMWMFSYHFVIWPILLRIPILALISLLVPAACCRLLKSSSIVERLRTE